MPLLPPVLFAELLPAAFLIFLAAAGKQLSTPVLICLYDALNPIHQQLSAIV
jgi:hypothetical protein